jgi:DNA-binding transcriptional regulator YiaG
MATNKKLKIKQPQVGKLIRELRQTIGLTQEEFAAEVGVVYPTVNRWENGHAQPSSMALKLIELKIEELGEKGQELLHKVSVNLQ